MPEFPPITEEGMRALPRWARVAFAAKCGRRILPLLRRFWTNSDQEALTSFEKAVVLAEQSAAQAIAVDGLDQALNEAEAHSPWMAGIAKTRLNGIAGQSSS